MWLHDSYKTKRDRVFGQCHLVHTDGQKHQTPGRTAATSSSPNFNVTYKTKSLQCDSRGLIFLSTGLFLATHLGVRWAYFHCKGLISLSTYSRLTMINTSLQTGWDTTGSDQNCCVSAYRPMWALHHGAIMGPT